MRRPRGRGAIVTATAVLGVILIALSVWSAISDYRNERESQTVRLGQAATAEGQELSNYFERARAVTALLARNRVFADHERSYGGRAHRRSESHVEEALTGMEDLTLGVGEACFTGGTGEVRACAIGGAVTASNSLRSDYGRSSFFEPALRLDPGEVHQTRPYVSNTNYYVIASATPVDLPAGRRNAVIHVETPIDAFREAATRFQSGFEIAVVDRADDTVVFDTADDSTQIGESSLGEFLPEEGTPDAGASYEIGGRLAVLQPVITRSENLNRWIVVARAPTPLPGFAASIGAPQIALFTGGLLLLAAAFVILRSSRRAEEETAQMKGDLLGLVSHELRTPLTSIIGYTELLTEMEGDSLSDQARSFIDVIDRNAQRELRLVGDLLTLQQIDRGGFSINATPQDLTPVVESALESARPKAEQKRIEMNADLAPGIEVPVDAERLGQVLDNLLSNAIKYTPDDGDVDVRLFAERSTAVLEVVDTGLGIPADELDQLFERMYRASNATELHIPGVGLGLSIAKAIVDEHDGTITVSSAVGEGTTFRVELPIAAATAPGGSVPVPDGDRVATPA